jgi:PAS domain S-box-containing protein
VGGDALISLLYRLPDAVLVLDRAWHITFANEEARRISRLSSLQLNSKTHWELYPETVGTPVERAYIEVMETGVSAHFEHYYEPFDVYLDVHVIAMPDGIALHYRDIGDRKRAEATRDATARRLNQVLEVTTDAVASLDRNWNYTFLNSRAVQLLDREDLLGKNLWEEYPAAAHSNFSVYYRRCMAERVPTEFEAYYPAPLERWLSLLCRPSDDGMVVFFRDITERKRSEQVFRRQRELITFVQQASRTAFWNLDLATGNLSFDIGSYPVFGHDLSKLTGVPAFRAIVHPGDRAQVTADVARAVESGGLIVNEFRVIDAEGHVVWLEARSQTAVVDGNAVSLGGMTIDITERKRAEEALATSEQRYRVLTELSPQFIWMGSSDGDITYANQGFLDYLGFTLADVGGERWLTAFDLADRPRVLEAWCNSVATGEVYEIEARLIQGSTGESRWWWLRALPLRGDSGNISDWLGVCMDIHDRKTAADALHQKQLETERQRAELETLYKTAPIGLALFDPVEFRYLRLNDRQAEIVGLPPEEVLGRRLTEIAPIPGLEEMFQQVAGGTPIRNRLLEGTVAARPEEHRSWNVNYFPVYNSDGSIRAITAASLEITHQKKAEAALIQSEKLAAVGRLASSISHEINNPLEAVTNLLYLIANDPKLAPELTFYLSTAQSELARVCQIATQTLRFHRQAMRPTMVTAEQLVGAVLSLYQGRLANSGISVEANYCTQTPVLCLENDIRQVLNNLIANAIDAMRHGGRLIVRAHDATDGHGGTEGRRGIRITIADTGHGMSEEVKARIFEPFYTTKALNGTGLGLWISHGIIERHGGQLRIRSSEDIGHRGTVAIIFLPHAEPHS